MLGLTTSELGWLFGLQAVTTLAVRPVIGFVSDRAGLGYASMFQVMAAVALVMALVFATTSKATAAERNGALS